jgi:hypothetical protein
MLAVGTAVVKPPLPEEIDMSQAFEELVEQAKPQVQELARRAKQIIQDAMPGVVEVVWLTQNIASYGVGPKKMSEHFCYIALFQERINLGFYYGADLADPENLLAGTGKALRHIKIAQPEQLENPALHQLVVTASTHLPKLKK